MDPFDLQLWNDFASSGGNRNSSSIIDQICIDSRRIDSTNSLFVALKGHLDGHQFVADAAKRGAKFALVSQDWHPNVQIPEITLLRVKNPLSAFQALAKTYRRSLGSQVIGITGSYGKTMVKDLLQLLLGTKMSVAASPESFNSQIGVPLSLFTIKKNHEIAIIEAAISKKSEMESLGDMIMPNFAIFTHLGKKHLATLGTSEIAAEEMMKLLFHPSENDWVLLPNHPHLTPLTPKISAKAYLWNQENQALPHATALSSKSGSKMTYAIKFPDGYIHKGEITTGFSYFLDLINLAVKAAWLLGISSENISFILKDFTPEPIRTEIWKTATGITFINDAYSCDPQSIDQALRFYQQAPEDHRRVFVFSGLRNINQPAQETAYRHIGQSVVLANVKLLLLVGNHPFTALIEEVRKSACSTKIVSCQNHKEALSYMQKKLKTSDIVLVKGEKKEPLDELIETFNDSICNNQCFINLDAIAANIAILRKKQPQNHRIMVMVKALAYGTDDVRIAKFLEKCQIDILGVSYVDEGITLRRQGVSQSIFVINAALYEVVKAVKWQLEIGVSDRKMIEALSLEAVNQDKKIKVHLHIDTGMGRFGCRKEEALSLAKLIVDSPSLELEGIMTHFACADNPSDDSFTLSQSRDFDVVIQELHECGIHPKWCHAANSSAAMRFDFSQYNMSRIGLAVYGLYASTAVKSSMRLRPALSLISRIVSINTCKSGETVSYGRSYHVSREKQKIAVLPIGYFDGLHRNYSGKASVLVKGQKAAMIGNICMDFMMIDVTDIPEASVGDHVLIFGEDEHGHYLSPESLASSGDSIIHELITCLGPRIQRIFLHEENK